MPSPRATKYSASLVAGFSAARSDASPGLASLRAALNPASSDALYFVARGDGTSQFSRTLEEHNQAVVRYQLKGGKR